MLYRIVNMSDPYTIEAERLDIAVVACAMLGAGQYAFEPTEAGHQDKAVPLFMFGGIDEWCKEKFGQPFEAVLQGILDERPGDLATCLESCLIGDHQDRKTYQDGLALITEPDKRKEWRDRWHDERRGSLNDIGGRAYAMARNLREKSGNPIIPAPPQVFTS